MIWALDGQVAARAGAVASPTTADEVADGAGACATRRSIPVTAAAGRSGVCGASVPAPRRRRARPLRPVRASSTSTRPRSCSTWPGHLRRPPRARAAGRARPHARPLAAVGRAVDRRRLAGVPVGAASSRPATGRSRTWCWGSTWRSPTAAGSAPGARRGPPPGPTSTSCSSAPRAPSGSSPAPGSGCIPHPPTSGGAPTASRASKTGSTRCAGSSSAAARPAVLRLYDAIEADRTYQTGDRALLLVLDEGEGAAVDATMELVAEVCREAERADPAHVGHWLEHRNDVAALEALISRGLRRRHHGGRGSLAGPARDLHDCHRRAPRGRGHHRRVGPPVAQLHRRWLPLLHVRGQDRAR